MKERLKPLLCFPYSLEYLMAQEDGVAIVIAYTITNPVGLVLSS